AAQAERAERRAARRRAVTSVLPERRPRPTGVLARRHRRQAWTTVAIVVGLNVLALAFLDQWSARAMVAVVSLLTAPVLHTLLFRR
ncbi:MAG: hypothetical protein Q8O61_04705, partial [Nocardioides sp.]|nr:hypothetical protein [Nocardioides sp.]